MVMAMVDAFYWLPIGRPVTQASCRGPKDQSWWLLGAVLYSSLELSELSQWYCHDDSTIKIILLIIVLDTPNLDTY